MTNLQNLSRHLRSNDSDKVMIPSSVEYVLSLVSRRKARGLSNDITGHSTMQASRIPNIRDRANSLANCHNIYEDRQVDPRVEMKVPRRRSSSVIREHRIKSSQNRDRSYSRDSNFEVEQKTTYQLPTNLEYSPPELPASFSNLRNRTSSIPKKVERAIYERSAGSKSLVSNVSHHPYSAKGSILNPSLSLPQLVKQEDKDQKMKSIELCCDKCDGKHETEECPHYKKKREGHIDAQKNGWKLVGGSSNLPGAFLRHARIVSQAGDGSCLFHSLSFGLRDGSDASSLRQDICTFIHVHPNTPICDTPLSDWVKWDSSASCAEYARRMSSGAWGGGIEMACSSILKCCNVHVYESVRTGGYKRISAFDHPIRPDMKRTVRILYRGGVHYDALVSGE